MIRGAKAKAINLAVNCRLHPREMAHMGARPVDFVDAIPPNPSGKILRRELREPYWRSVERRVHR